jgi:hypothetical protein
MFYSFAIGENSCISERTLLLLALWAVQQQQRFLLFVVALPKEPRQAHYLC